MRGPFALCFVALALVPACYRSQTRPARPDAPAPDAGPGDAPVGRLDAPRDVPADARPDTPLSRVGCRSDSECDEGLCVLDVREAGIDLTPAPLVCGVAGRAAPATECEENAECENGLCAFAGGCVEPCRTSADCPSSDRCAPVWVITGREAMQQVSACVRWVDAPEGIAVVENGAVTVTPFASNELTLGTAFRPRRTVLLVAPRSSTARTVDRVTLDGRVVFDATDFTAAANPAVAFFDLASVLLPNAPLPAGTNPRGGLGVTLTTEAESELRRIVLEYDGTGTNLDLNVYWLGIAQNASRRRIVSRMIDDSATLLASFGARLGRVRQRVAVGGTLDARAIADDEQEAAENFAYGAGAARPALDVFLIASGTTLLGMAGGIPGAMTMHGTRSSGVVIGLDDLETGIDGGFFGAGYPPVLLAHEIGHFLGLFHTSEADGTVIEPLDDTPACEASRDENGDGVLEPSECGGFGAENVMFWGVQTSAATFSPSQRDVLRGAAVLSP
jgi:hypothetical protein